MRLVMSILREEGGKDAFAGYFWYIRFQTPKS
jgi:hypothetical protein